MIIYTPAAGDVLRDCLNAIAMLTPSATFSTLTEIIITVSVFATMWVYIAKQDIQILLNWFVYSFVIIALLLGLKENVEVIDMSNESKIYTVSNVPIGVAVPAFFIGGAGYIVTKGFSLFFHMPDDLDYNKSGMIFGARIWTGALDSNFNMDPNLSFDLTNYVTQCFFKSKMLVTRKISAEDLRTSSNLKKLLFTNPSKVYRIITHDGRNLSCVDASAEIKGKINEATKPELNKLALKLNKDNLGEARQILKQAHTYYTTASKNAATILTQNMLINSVRQAQKNVLAQTGSVGHLMNLSNTESLQKVRMAEANDLWLSEYQLPQLMSSLWIITICMFPLCVLISLFPGCNKVYMYYIYSMAYLWTWPPLFVVIHFIVSSKASHAISLLTAVTEGGITLSNIDALKSINSDWALNAGRLTGCVPFIAIGLIKGFSSVFSHASQQITGISQSASMSEAQTVTQGNISMGNYSGWNMNFDNENAHKHDVNSTHFSGQNTTQDVDTGALKHASESTNQVSYSPGTSMSQSAVSVQGSQSLLNSFTKAKEHSLQEMDGHQASFTDSTTHAGSHATQFSEQDGHDQKLGDGVSSSGTASAQQALSRVMHQARDIADKTGMSVNEAFTGLTRASIGGSVGVDTADSLGGKLGKWAFGAKGELHINSSGDRSHSDTTSHNVDSSYTISGREAKDIRHDINVIETYSKNHHFDTNNTSSENLLIQTGNDLRKAETASEGYSVSLQKSQRASEAFSSVESGSTSLGLNLDQRAVEYGRNKLGGDRMDYLESHHADPAAFEELRSIKQEYIDTMASNILKGGVNGADVDPNSAYESALQKIHEKSDLITSNYDIQSSGKIHQGREKGLGVNQGDKEKMLQESDKNFSQAKEKISSNNRDMETYLNNNQKVITQKLKTTKHNINSHPVGSVLSGKDVKKIGDGG